jgi:DNA repair exonuclease SbcCD nuclease subunit
MRLNKDKFVCLSDIHLVPKNPVCRLDDLTEVQWRKLDEVFETATLRNADVIIAGDLHAISNDYEVLARFAAFLLKYQELDTHVWAVYGQHDLKYRNPENTNLDILVKSGLINIIPPEGITNGGIRICGCGWMDEVPEPDMTRINVLVIHAPISPKALFHGHSYIDAWAFMYEHPFDITICGDVHRTFCEDNDGHVCLNSGPLLRREADEYSFAHKPGFWFLNLDEISFDFVSVEHTPSEECLTRKHISKSKEKKSSFDEANTAKFLYELKNRTDAGKIMKIEDRMKSRILSKDSELSPDSKEIIETLLNGKGLTEWLQKPKKLSRIR